MVDDVVDDELGRLAALLGYFKTRFVGDTQSVLVQC